MVTKSTGPSYGDILKRIGIMAYITTIAQMEHHSKLDKWKN